MDYHHLATSCSGKPPWIGHLNLDSGFFVEYPGDLWVEMGNGEMLVDSCVAVRGDEARVMDSTLHAGANP